MIIKIVAMHKDEDLLLETWALYHSAMFGSENVFIIDNGSTKTKVKGTLVELENIGINVIYDYSSPDHFAQKGQVVANIIKELDSDNPADFYFPLDCDEFLCIFDREIKKFLFGYDNITHYLRSLIGKNETLTIGYGADNCPWDVEKFIVKGRKKCFFTQNNCYELDIGFHKGRSVRSPFYFQTSICYLHLHNKPIDRIVSDAKQKMLNRVDSFDRDYLIKYKEEKKRGWHLIDELLIENDSDYINFIKNKYVKFNLVNINEFERDLNAHGLTYPYVRFLNQPIKD